MWPAYLMSFAGDPCLTAGMTAGLFVVTGVKAGLTARGLGRVFLYHDRRDALLRDRKGPTKI